MTDLISSPFEDDDTPVIDLTERVHPAAGRAGVAGPSDACSGELADETLPVDALDEAMIHDARREAPPDDFVGSLGLDIQSSAGSTAVSGTFAEARAAAAEEGAAAPGRDFEARIETVLQRVIEKMYADKIEGILVETVERVVRREIEELKSVLTGDEEG